MSCNSCYGRETHIDTWPASLQIIFCRSGADQSKRHRFWLMNGSDLKFLIQNLIRSFLHSIQAFNLCKRCRFDGSATDLQGSQFALTPWHVVNEQRSCIQVRFSVQKGLPICDIIILLWIFFKCLGYNYLIFIFDDYKLKLIIELNYFFKFKII